MKFSVCYAFFALTCGLAATPIRAQSTTSVTVPVVEISSTSAANASESKQQLLRKTAHLTQTIVPEKIPHHYLTQSEKSSCAAADDSDKGLQHRFHIALGVASISHSDSGSSTESGFAAKVDWSYFRPTRHEAVATLWFVNVSGANTEALTTEYRWRFGGHGIAYYGLGLGVATGNGLNSVVFTDGLGVDLGRFTLEVRSLSSGSDSAYMFMAGARF
ncbi:MAG: hypothetical protein JWN14_1231 [Chthonomonadales bacterium]|nr:hypothetical protein [Chthonomonadales bacterium]